MLDCKSYELNQGIDTMNIDELIDYVNNELSLLKPRPGKELTTYRVCLEIIAKCHKLLDRVQLNQESIEDFVTPIRYYVFDLVDSDDEEKVLTRVKNWQKASRGNPKGFFTENIDAINGVTGYEVKGEFTYYAYDSFSLSSEQWRALKESKIIAKQHDSLIFDLDLYLQTTEQLLLSDNPYEQLGGLIASLGRRPTELFNPNSFELVDGHTHTFKFNGQLKTKKDIVDSYEIGTIFEASNLFEIWQSAINNVEIQSKLELINQLFEDDDIKKHEMIDDRFNAIINKVVKEHYQFIPIPLALQTEQTGVTCRILRRCYSTIIVSRECSIGDIRKCLDYYSMLLGHTNNDSTTKGYLDYTLFDLNDMFFSLDIPNFDINLSLDNRKKLYFLMEESGDDVNDLMSKMITCYELNKVKTIIFSDTPWQVLKGSNTPKSGNEKVARAVKAIIEHNECQGEHELTYCITSRAVMDLTGSRHSVVKAYFDEYSDIINAHNDKYDLTPVHNRGKRAISEVVIIN